MTMRTPAPRLHALFALVAVATLVAGCATVLPQPYAPQRTGYDWTATEARPWLVRQTRCMECAPDDPRGAHKATVVFEDGAVLRIAYALGPYGGRPAPDGLAFANASWRAYSSAVTQAWLSLYGEAPQQLTVVGLDARQLAVKDADPVLRVLDHGLRAAQDPGPPSFDCACPGITYHAFGPPRTVNATLGHPLPADEGWALIEAEMGLVHHWLDNPPAQRPIG